MFVDERTEHDVLRTGPAAMEGSAGRKTRFCVSRVAGQVALVDTQHDAGRRKRQLPRQFLGEPDGGRGSLPAVPAALMAVVYQESAQQHGAVPIRPASVGGRVHMEHAHAHHFVGRARNDGEGMAGGVCQGCVDHADRVAHEGVLAGSQLQGGNAGQQPLPVDAVGRFEGLQGHGAGGSGHG